MYIQLYNPTSRGLDERHERAPGAVGLHRLACGRDEPHQRLIIIILIIIIMMMMMITIMIAIMIIIMMTIIISLSSSLIMIFIIIIRRRRSLGARAARRGVRGLAEGRAEGGRLVGAELGHRLPRGQKTARQKSTPQKSSWILSGVFKWMFSGIFQWIVTFVISGG